MGILKKCKLSQGGILWLLKTENYSWSSGDLKGFQTEGWQKSEGINMQEGTRNECFHTQRSVDYIE